MKPLTLTDGAYDALMLRFRGHLDRGQFALADMLIPRIERVTARSMRPDNAQLRRARAVATHNRAIRGVACE